MKCLVCQTENERDATFCVQCGHQIYTPSQKSLPSEKLTTWALMVFLTLGLLWDILGLTMNRFVFDNKFGMVFTVLNSSMVVLLALSIRNKKWKIIMLVMAMALFALNLCLNLGVLKYKY